MAEAEIYNDEFPEDYEEEEEFEEVEEMLDDQPMRIVDNVFIGSIDAALNSSALKQCNIGFRLALLDQSEIIKYQTLEQETKVQFQIIQVEDSLEEKLLQKLPKILYNLREMIELAKEQNQNVLVHCVAGRSRSASAIVAYLMTSHQSTLNASIEKIMMIRPWIEINTNFQCQLELFQTILSSDCLSACPSNIALSSIDRIHFDSSLVDFILSENKQVTIRLLTDLEDDRNSDLQNMFKYSLVAATTGEVIGDTKPRPFALVRIEKVETIKFQEIDATLLEKSNMSSLEALKQVLEQFYPPIRPDTVFRAYHFKLLTQL